MHSGELEQSRYAITETHQQEPIESRGISDFGQVGPRIQADGGKSKDSGDSQTDPVRSGLPMYPEGHPR